MLMLVFVACVLFCACVNIILKNRRYPKPPLCSGSIPVLGHCLKLLGNSEYRCKLMYSIGEECNRRGGVLLVKLACVDFYVVTDPEDFITAANQCLEKHYSYQFLSSWLGTGLIVGKDTTIWRRHRKLLSPAFGQHVIDGFLPIFNDMSMELVRQLKPEVGKGPFDHAPYLDSMSLESICQTAFGVTIETDTFNTKSYMAAAQQMLHIITQRFCTLSGHSEFLYGLTSLKAEQDKVLDSLNQFSDEILKAKKKSVNETNTNGTRFKAFMDLALELSDKGALTEKEVWEEMNTIILAGYETTGNTLMYTLMLLGSHINVQNKVYEELQNVFGDSEREVEKQDLTKLVYLDAVIKESLRLYCITPVMLRRVSRDVKLKNYTLPANSTCLLFNVSVHYHDFWGCDVREFRPERWLDPVALLDNTSAIHTAFTGFGVGKRLCLGKNYAMMSMKTTLSHVLRHYRVTSDVTQLKLKVDPLLKPVSGHHIALQFRN